MPLWFWQGTETMTLWPSAFSAVYSATTLLLRPSSLLSTMFSAIAGLLATAARSSDGMRRLLVTFENRALVCVENNVAKVFMDDSWKDRSRLRPYCHLSADTICTGTSLCL